MKQELITCKIHGQVWSSTESCQYCKLGFDKDFKRGKN